MQKVHKYPYDFDKLFDEDNKQSISYDLTLN
jgi:hypothetical protein